jgi:hypothetical protein
MGLPSPCRSSARLPLLPLATAAATTARPATPSTAATAKRSAALRTPRAETRATAATTATHRTDLRGHMRRRSHARLTVGIRHPTTPPRPPTMRLSTTTTSRARPPRAAVTTAGMGMSNTRPTTRRTACKVPSAGTRRSGERLLAFLFRRLGQHFAAWDCSLEDRSSPPRVHVYFYTMWPFISSNASILV